MLVRDVGENGYVILDPHHALQGEPMRAGFDHGVPQFGIAHPGQLLLNLQRLQGGLARIVWIDGVAQADVHRAH